MGTKGLIGFYSRKDKEYIYTNNIIGMTSDGVPHNLLCIANEFFEIAFKNKIQLSCDNYINIHLVSKLLIKNDSFLFIDDFSNVNWVSYSLFVNCDTKELHVYEGDDFLYKRLINKLQNIS